MVLMGQNTAFLTYLSNRDTDSCMIIPLFQVIFLQYDLLKKNNFLFLVLNHRTEVVAALPDSRASLFAGSL